ncbi:hypothetical protein CIB48_g7952 [Xylaria polymorpha]|nr:hypothetical protein CIB48_g7952 [Xylaria polymorpha]
MGGLARRLVPAICGAGIPASGGLMGVADLIPTGRCEISLAETGSVGLEGQQHASFWFSSAALFHPETDSRCALALFVS